MAAASLFLLFFLSIVTLSLASVNIDCGTSIPSVDESSIKWVGDKEFITTGESATVSSTTIDKALTTLRYFPTGESNCYSNIPVTKGGKVLVRTTFYYGNYDGKSSFPTFTVSFEGKHQGTVTITSASELAFLELIFAPASGETSVCFLRTSASSNPFVSAIEVYDLAAGMYDELGPGEGFFYHERVAYGAAETLSLDPHGRFWLQLVDPQLTGLPSTAASIDTSGASNKPPESILRTFWSAETLTLADPFLPSKGVPLYLAMYFSEPLTTGIRSFNIFLDSTKLNKAPVVPVFGEATQLVVRDVVMSSSSLLVFQSTAPLLPPIINAMEIYVISKGSSGGGGGSGGGANKGDTRGPNEMSSGGSTNEGKKSKLPIIIGVVGAVVFLLITYVFLAVILTNRRKARLQALAIPTSAVANMGTGASPLFGQQIGHDSSKPANEAGIADIDDMIGVNQSYITQRH